MSLDSSPKHMWRLLNVLATGTTVKFYMSLQHVCSVVLHDHYWHGAVMFYMLTASMCSADPGSINVLYTVATDRVVVNALHAHY